MRSFVPVFLAVAVMMVPVSSQALDLNPFSAIKSAVEAIAEDRSSGDIAKDLEINATITVDVIDKMGSDVISISVDVYEQDVMLTGVVETASQKEQAGQLAKGVEEVKKVHNEILVMKKVDKEKGAVKPGTEKGHRYRSWYKERHRRHQPGQSAGQGIGPTLE